MGVSQETQSKTPSPFALKIVFLSLRKIEERG